MPGYTPCYQCIEKSFHRDDAAEISSNLEWMSEVHPAWAAHNFISAAISVDQILKYLSGFQNPIVLNSVLALDYFKLQIRKIGVDKNCGCCSLLN